MTERTLAFAYMLWLAVLAIILLRAPQERAKVASAKAATLDTPSLAARQAA